jgi:site-specific DNA recombinase
MTELRALLKERGVDVVIAHALDRVSRNQAHQGLILSEIDHAGAQLEFVTEKLEDTPEGRLLLSVYGYVAEIERLKIRERTNRGRRARAQAGKMMPGPRPLYGYRWAPDTDEHGKLIKGQLIADLDTAPIVQRIFRELAGGSPCGKLPRG